MKTTLLRKEYSEYDIKEVSIELGSYRKLVNTSKTNIILATSLYIFMVLVATIMTKDIIIFLIGMIGVGFTAYDILDIFKEEDKYVRIINKIELEQMKGRIELEEQIKTRKLKDRK